MYVPLETPGRCAQALPVDWISYLLIAVALLLHPTYIGIGLDSELEKGPTGPHLQAMVALSYLRRAVVLVVINASWLSEYISSKLAYWCYFYRLELLKLPGARLNDCAFRSSLSSSYLRTSDQVSERQPLRNGFRRYHSAHREYQTTCHQW